MKLAGLIITVGLLAAFGLWLTPHLEFDQPFIGYSVAGAFLLFLASRPQKIELAITSLLGLILGIVITHQGLLPRMLVTLAAGFGLASVAVMISSFIWGFPRPRRQTWRALAPAATLIFFVGSAVHTLIAGFFRQHTYDLYAYAMDGSFGAQPSFVAGQMIHGKVWPTYAVVITYELVVIAIAAFYAAFMSRRERPLWELIELLFGASLLGYVFYSVFPATGPGYVFGMFPSDPVSFEQLKHFTPQSIPISMHFPRNAVPSLHLGWALLIWWNSRSLPKWSQVMAGLFVLGTAFSALAIGEHYLFDFLVAMPFALMVQSLMIRTVKITDRSRWVPAVFGLVVFLIWLAIGRFGLPLMFLNKAIPWSLAIVSSAVCLTWAFQLPPLIPEMQSASLSAVLNPQTADPLPSTSCDPVALA